ncbi:Uncharacterised protein [Mycobacteroides abscessus subsp. abscessus]|nr:Uncharacterised protein [Mycobacteroides abscessus subsp. abscessus]
MASAEVTAAATVSPAANSGSGSRNARLSTNAPSRLVMNPSMSRRRVLGGSPVSAIRSAPCSIQSVKTSAVACRKASSVLATSSAIVAIGQASV